MARLGDVATYINGYAFKPTDWSNEGIPIIRIQDLTGNSYQTNRYNGKYDPKYEVNYGDVLISWSASLGVYVWTGETAVLNQHIFKVQFDKADVDKDFFVHQVECILNNASSEVHGATMKHLTKPIFDALPFYLPKVDEQKKIANELNRVTSLISLRKQQLSKSDELVKARFVELFGDPVADSMTWGQLPLSHYLKSIRYGTSTPPPFSETGYEFIRATNIKNGQIISSDMKYISEEEAKKIEKCKVFGGEMIIVRSGVNAGDTCIITDEHCGQYAGYDMILVFGEALHPIFVNVLINTEYMDRVVKPLTRRAAQPHLNSEQVQSLPIIQVPYDQQEKFAAFVEQTDKSKFEIQKSLEKLETLKKALMQKYFG